MPISALALIGAGGHAVVVGDAAMLLYNPTLTIYSQDALQVGQKILSCAVELLETGAQVGHFHVAIGSNSVRARIYQELSGGGNVAVTVTHPRATISASAEIGEGSFIAAAAVVAPRSRIGRAVIVNHHAVVDHDVSVDDYAHIAPGVVLGGGVRVGRQVLVGAGATILPGVSIGDGAVVGAGAVVLHDVPAGQTAVGVPAKWM
jgi:sugar O-acyltransferase (sialic acid O-acetyltransferase NeuD family)